MRKRWLVLVGGGGCGRWQAGALVSLYKAGLLQNLDGIVGTSVGGMNACALAAGMAMSKGPALLEQAWSLIKGDEDVYEPGLTSLMASPWAHPLNAMGATRGFLGGPAACSTDKLAALVGKLLAGWTTERLRQLAQPLLLVRAYSYAEKRGVTLTGDLVAMALATSAIEAVFPRRWGYGDGGAVDNKPIDVALNFNATEILVVYCGPEAPQPFPRPPAMVRTTDAPGDASTGLKDALALLGGITLANEDLVDQAAGRAELQGMQVVHCFPASDTGNALDFTERGLWQRGQAEAALAISQAKAKGW